MHGNNLHAVAFVSNPWMLNYKYMQMHKMPNRKPKFSQIKKKS